MTKDRSKSLRRLCKTGFVFLIVFPLAMLILGELPFELAGHLLFGWITYLGGVLPRISFNDEIFVDFAVTLILATVGLHRLLGWWARSRECAQWQYRSTLKIVLMVLLLFATSIAATGIVHQVGWLARADRLVVNTYGYRALSTRELAMTKNLILPLFEYQGDHEGKLPPDLISLVPQYVPNRIHLFSSIDPSEPPEPFLYFPKNTGNDPSKVILLAGPHPSPSGRRGVAFHDGSVHTMKEDEFQSLLTKQTPP
jgi:hypothetical protein